MNIHKFIKHLLLIVCLAGFVFNLHAEPEHMSSIFQMATVSLDMKNVPLKDVFDKIEEQTELVFIYNNNDVDVDRKTSVKAKSEPVEHLLDRILEGTDIGYTVDNKYILLKKSVDETSTKQLQQDNVKITGKVFDRNSVPVIGASIAVKGTTLGTQTDADGNFTFAVPSNAVLVVSYIGYFTQEITIDDRRNFTITLNETMQQIDEVVVVGYGVQKKINLTGAVGYTTSEVLQNRPITNVAQGLQGVIPNLNVTFASGNPNGTPTVTS